MTYSFPLVKQDDIEITEPRPSAFEYDMGVQRLQANFSYTAECGVSLKSQAYLKFSVKDQAIQLLKTRVIRRLYPKEIGRALHDLKGELINDPRVQISAVRDYIEKLDALLDALQPVVK